MEDISYTTDKNQSTSMPWDNITYINPTFAPAQLYRVSLITLTFAGCSSILSILGSFVIFWVFHKFQDIRWTSKRLLMFLTIADFLIAAGNLVGVIRYVVFYYVNEDTYINDDECDDPGIVCKVQSFITTSASLMSFLWMAVISGYFHISIAHQNQTSVAERFLWPCHALCWGFPVVITSVAVSFNLLGEDMSLTSGSWCWLTICQARYDTDNRTIPILWMLFTGKLWEILTFLVMCINYVGVKYIISNRLRIRDELGDNWLAFCNSYDSESSGESDGDMVYREVLHPGDEMFIYMPFIMLVLRCWGTVKFILVAVADNEIYSTLLDAEIFLTFLQGIGDSGQAFCNFFLFCVLTKEVRTRIMAWYRGYEHIPGSPYHHHPHHINRPFQQRGSPYHHHPHHINRPFQQRYDLYTPSVK